MVKLTRRTGDNKSQLSTNDHRSHSLLVTRERGTWCRHITLADNALGTCIPVPQQHSAICRSGGYITVRGNIALGACHAGDNAEVSKYDLHDFRCSLK